MEKQTYFDIISVFLGSLLSNVKLYKKTTPDLKTKQKVSSFDLKKKKHTHTHTTLNN